MLNIPPLHTFNLHVGRLVTLFPALNQARPAMPQALTIPPTAFISHNYLHSFMHYFLSKLLLLCHLLNLPILIIIDELLNYPNYLVLYKLTHPSSTQDVKQLDTRVL